MMNNVGREHQIWFNMSDNGYFYFGPTSYCFIDFIWDCLTDKYDGYFMFSRTLPVSFRLFESLFSLDDNYKSDEKFG